MQLTETAAAKVKELLQHSMLPTDSVSDQDHAEEHYGVRVAIDRDSAPLLSEATIDFKDSPSSAHARDPEPPGHRKLYLPPLVSRVARPDASPHAPPWRRQ